MAKITAFDRRNLRELHARVAAALKAVGDEFGINFEVKAGRFSPELYRFTSEAKVGAAPSASDKERERRREFERFCVRFGLKPEHYGAAFVSQGKQFTICGLQPNAPKFPVLARSTRGAVYKFKVEATGFVTAEAAQLAREADAEARWEARVS